MVQKVVTIYMDDLTGIESDEVSTYRFSLNGVEYEIDLTPESYDRLDSALRQFIENGRKMRRIKSARTRKTPVAASAEEVRAWARDNGYKVNARGRIPSEIRQAFNAAR
ncbi:hypothetical protein ABIE67_009824 [Streptomyces sp. V4I8]|uniref:histone-like nucleoid-structuring protein Lsr2 n=1 Tax=Streptomyces sp. V4I8 TaxID=3156469 RepID=UPI003519AE70